MHSVIIHSTVLFVWWGPYNIYSYLLCPPLVNNSVLGMHSIIGVGSGNETVLELRAGYLHIEAEVGQHHIAIIYVIVMPASK